MGGAGRAGTALRIGVALAVSAGCREAPPVPRVKSPPVAPVSSAAPIPSATTAELPVPFESPELHQTEKPQFTWWVQVRDRKGRVGWTDKPENFGNKDRCA